MLLPSLYRRTNYVTAASVLALAVGFSGCAHSYKVKVDALANPEVTGGAAYQLVPKDAVKADFEPRYDHAVHLIETALASRGYHRAVTPRDAEVMIEVDFGVGSRRKSAIEDVNLFSVHHPAASPLSKVPSASAAPGPVHPADPQLNEPPPLTRVTVITLYEKYLTLSARETPRVTLGLRKAVEVWRVSVAIEDRQPTVDECLSVLVRTAAENIGSSTAARTRIRVTEEAPTAVLAKNDR